MLLSECAFSCYDMIICSNYITCKQIRNMEHMIQHETLPLKDEKQFIREIKQLKQTRDRLSSHMGRQDEVQQGLEIEVRLKVVISICSSYFCLYPLSPFFLVLFPH